MVFYLPLLAIVFLRLKVDFQWSNELTFDAAIDDQRSYVCRSGFPAALCLRDGLFRRGRYIDLVPASEQASLPPVLDDISARIIIFLLASFILAIPATAACAVAGASNSVTEWVVAAVPTVLVLLLFSVRLPARLTSQRAPEPRPDDEGRTPTPGFSWRRHCLTTVPISVVISFLLGYAAARRFGIIPPSSVLVGLMVSILFVVPMTLVVRRQHRTVQARPTQEPHPRRHQTESARHLLNRRSTPTADGTLPNRLTQTCDPHSGKEIAREQQASVGGVILAGYRHRVAVCDNASFC